MNTYEDAAEVSAQDEIDFFEGSPEEDFGIFVPEADGGVTEDELSGWDVFGPEDFEDFEDAERYAYED